MAQIPWIDRANLRIFAIVETKLSDGKCGIVMTGESKRRLNIAMGRMILCQKRAYRRFEVVEFTEQGTGPNRLHH